MTTRPNLRIGGGAWGSAVGAGVAYFAVVFAFGFVMGALRTLLVAPAIGEIAAVLLELPVMLAASWLACRALVARLGVGDDLAARLLMGALAFALLMTGEVVLSVLLFERAPAEFFAGFRDPPGWLGLAGQIGFAAIPALQRGFARR